MSRGFLGLWGGSNASTAEIPDSLGIQIEDVKADRPEFKRRYTAKLTGQVSIKIEIRTFSLGQIYFGELDQNDGNWVLFDPEKPAEKILDHELLPLIEKYCGGIIALDKKYRNSNPDAFTDEGGNVWKRQP